MFLVICAQDIKLISFGLFEKKRLVTQATCEATPEEYLHALDQTLQTWGSKDVLSPIFEGVIVVTGPGSFTASRVSTTLANGFAFARSLPVRGLSNPQMLEMEALLVAQADGVEKTAFVTPVYNRPATSSMPSSS